MTSGRRSRTVTVLFTDLVRSTELLTQLGEEAFGEVRRLHFSSIRAAVVRHGGEEIKTLGDGALAVFDSAGDAVRGAVAIQQAVESHARISAVPLTVRIGLALGDVSFEDDDVFGTPVVEAARLMAAARGGQILASTMVRLAGGAESGAPIADIGPLELKGLPEPVPACEVGWDPAAASLIPLPVLLTDMGRVFVGRQEPLAQLEQLAKEAELGDVRVAILAGEPGIGKTRLAGEVAALLHAQGAMVLAGRCDEDLGVPYQPLVEALRQFVDHVPDEALGQSLGRYPGELVRLVPELSDRISGLSPPLQSDPETECYRLFDAVGSWLADAARERLVVLVLDDLQWAAKPTLLLLRHVIRFTEHGRLLLVGTYRDTELGHDHPLIEVLADLRRDERVARVSLVGLDPLDVASFLEQHGGRVLDEAGRDLARAIHEETQGNPFFVREILRNLAESGALSPRPDGWALQVAVEDLGIPEGVRDVVGRRLSHLSAEANRVLAAAAVAGTEFDAALLENLEPLDEDRFVAALEEAATARLVTEVAGHAGRFRFSHSLVRDVLYGGLSTVRRMVLHRRLAEAIEATFPARVDDHLPALAYHWARAAPMAHAIRAAEYAQRAGHRALAQLAHHEAAVYFRQALELLELSDQPVDDGWRADLLIALGEAEYRSGNDSHRSALLEAARLAEGLGDADRLARAGLAGYRGLWGRSLSVDVELVGILEAALRLRGPEDDVIRAHLLAVLAAELMFTSDQTRRRALSDDAVGIARRLGDRATLARTLHCRCAALWAPSNLVERRANAAELRTLADGLGDPFVKVWACLYSFETAMEGGEIADADRHLDEADRSASEVERALRWFAVFPRVGRVLLAGNVEEADALALKALEIGQQTQPIYEVRLHFGVQRFQVRLEQGRVGDLLPRLVEASAEGHPETRAMLAQAYCETGRLEEARAVFDRLGPLLAGLPPDPNWIMTVTRSAAVSACLGDLPRAAAIYDQLLPYRDRIAGQGIVWTGAVAHYLGLLAAALGRSTEAEGHFTRAAELHLRLDAPAWLARTQLEQARLLRTRHEPGDADWARQLLAQALATARVAALPKVEQDVGDELRRWDPA
jgi:class 3 adenylate cyclase/tetratricopeptide (TPR) repeat protein